MALRIGRCESILARKSWKAEFPIQNGFVNVSRYIFPQPSKMSSSRYPPVTRAQLQAIPVKRRLDAIQEYIDRNVSQQVHLAAFTATSYFAPLPGPAPTNPPPIPPPYHVTGADLLEGLRAKYPDSCVMFYEKPVPTNRPGVTEQHMGILIDWS
jgi:hypothetical protein